MRKYILSVLILTVATSLFGREGMWLPILLNKNIDEMQEMGFKLTAEDIYSINQSSLKDAVVLFGKGCTGELISGNGLLVTNHHCGYGQIQSHSTLEHDYLTNGFWAMQPSEELPNKDLSVVFLVEMRNVTDLVLAGTDSLFSENEIMKKRDENISKIVAEAIKDTHYEGVIKPFFNGNQYYLFINERFTDVRLVGAPPSAIGKFGGDTDNWMWPRHTGDFSLFRIYADSLNKPAAYSPNNVPYKPKNFFKINMSGVEEGDFTMVFGYPGTTTQYLHSLAIKQIVEQRDPDRISIREKKLAIIGKAMEEDRATRIKYAAKYASTSNSWKKWQGEVAGLKRLGAIDRKISEERAFALWVSADKNRKYNYGNVLTEFEKLYAEIAEYQKAKDYFDEIVLRGADAYLMYGILKSLPNKLSSSRLKSELSRIEEFYKDFDINNDQQVFKGLMQQYFNNVPKNLQPQKLSRWMLKEKNHSKLDHYFAGSILFKQNDVVELLKNGDLQKLKKKLKKDKLCNIYDQLVNSYHKQINPEYQRISQLIEWNQKFYMAARLEMQNNEMLYPDANLTLRVSYGKVEGYVPADGVKYKYFTTLDGIIEKDNPEIYDYKVPSRLKELWAAKDFGPYANSNGEMPVCFAASNHTTGGNSGSPVIDENGYLIGINFDRGWEGTMSDILYDPEKSRNISLDVRYMLFLIDKYAGANYLLNEMEIIQK